MKNVQTQTWHPRTKPHIPQNPPKRFPPKRPLKTPPTPPPKKKKPAQLEAGRGARSATLNADEALAVKNLGLLTLKPLIYAANVGEDDLGNQVGGRNRRGAVLGVVFGVFLEVLGSFLGGLGVVLGGPSPPSSR
jgi:hypothetical protein